uniref:3-dehydroquinate synthase domain-containing protein n=1 Tax=Aplanochytrium stocchinoi TaxID=215587 RepID=A0A7S3V1D9_9STRA
MVDASVGGKTGVNTKHGKNLLGAFWQPILVHAAVDTLKTLDDAELRCGLGEVVKHGVLEEVQDVNGSWVPSCKFMEWIEENGSKLANRDNEALKYAIKRSCEIKGAIVKQDERETGKRGLLNLGHTIGHAIEHALGYGALRHGEAVAIGTVAETQLAVLRGRCEDKNLPKRIAKVLRACSLPTGVKGLSVDELLEATLMDKKRDDASIAVTMPHKIGDVRLEKMKPEELRPGFELLESNVGLAA